jgi:hypothetical protein
MSLSSVNTRTHSLLCLQRWLVTGNRMWWQELPISLHCIALVYIHPICTYYGTSLPTLVQGIHHLLPTMDDAKTTNYSTRDGLLPYLLQLQGWIAELTIYLP